MVVGGNHFATEGRVIVGVEDTVLAGLAEVLHIVVVGSTNLAGEGIVERVVVVADMGVGFEDIADMAEETLHRN